MHTIYFDAGTTNTRVYLLENYKLLCTKSELVGARNTAIDNSKARLKQTVRALYQDILVENGLKPADIEHVYISGMASSPDGLHEVDHLQTPVPLQKLRSSLVRYRDDSVIPQDIWLIPGIRTDSSIDLPTSPQNAVHMHMIRGEETEVFGLINKLDPHISYMVALPGSHTQIISIQNNCIADFFSGITGEIRDAVINHTILKSALSQKGPETLNPEFVLLGYRTLHECGFNHALYGVRTMDLFSKSTDAQRHSYFQGVLTGGMIDGVLQRANRNHWGAKRLIVVGRTIEYDAYHTIMPIAAPDIQVNHYDTGSIPLSVKGYIAIARGN
ncbi:2-dehydro-3-deoxygalactonokinase [Bifidobacterium sp. ESL0732]|uniref:2-dehydro-3-deoxygalactonokinase n=1 Tax=Bifidobacterium sp. ESL0732 TaxID=2983222 RepID=UPI0023F8D046|nr:2-dehydro-3-deoxygalactonokinase [Bifidobacterium sp. ESL0732]WEV63915.1 2-dehydro-3-deoxygalactonokinase [Bifidobacterium sp. ESL0732]